MYIDLLTKIKNAGMAKQEGIKTHYSKMDEAILSVLAKNRYIEDFDKKGRGPKKVLDVKIKYSDGLCVIKGLRFISKPSRRIYLGYKDIKPVRHGYGISVISTSKGIFSGKEAKKNKLGGELLFEIW